MVYHQVIKGMYGRALPERGIIHAPEGRTRNQLYILAHECGHINYGHNSKKPRHVKEHEAEAWVHAALRRHHVAVPRAMTRRARAYVGAKILEDLRWGTKHIDAGAARFARQNITESRRYVAWMFALAAAAQQAKRSNSRANAKQQPPDAASAHRIERR